MDKRMLASSVAVLLVACQPGLVSPPTEAEARQFFDRAVELAQAGVLAALCGIGGGNCERILDDAGHDVPEDPPRIIGTRVHQPTESTHGGIVLEICGRYDDGVLYYSEMIVSPDLDGELFAIELVYWAGMLIADDATVGGARGGRPHPPLRLRAVGRSRRPVARHD